MLTNKVTAGKIKKFLLKKVSITLKMIDISL